MSQAMKAREPNAKYFAVKIPSLLVDFELVATAHGAVSNLRNLILALAVGGKLVKQNSSDEPAVKALSRSLEQRKAMRSHLSGKPSRYLFDAPLTSDAESVLPKGWVQTQLGQLVDSIKSGGTPSKNNPSYWGGNIPWASVKDLKFGTPIFNAQDKITEAGLAAGASLAEKGSIIICTRMGLGKIGEAMIDVAINQDLKALKLGSCIDKNYFIIVFKTLKIVGSGMTVAGIKQEELLAFPISLPPLAEQHRIVARVEELMKLCDALEARGRLAKEQHARLTSTLFDALATSESAHALTENWQRIAEHFDLLLDRPEAVDALEQAILQLAVRGLLVPQDANDDPASNLLAQLNVPPATTGIRGRRAKQNAIEPAPDIEDVPFDVPQLWSWTQFATVAHIASDLVDPFAYKHLPQVAPDCIEKGSGRLVASRSVKDAGVISANHRFCAGQILYSKIRPSLSKVVIVDFAGLCSADMYPIDAKIHSGYLHLFMLSNCFLDQVKVAENRVKMPKINQEALNAFLVAVPPLAEQLRIVARVEALRRFCAQLRERIMSARRTQRQLAEALVQTVTN